MPPQICSDLSSPSCSCPDPHPDPFHCSSDFFSVSSSPLPNSVGPQIHSFDLANGARWGQRSLVMCEQGIVREWGQVLLGTGLQGSFQS